MRPGGRRQPVNRGQPQRRPAARTEPPREEVEQRHRGGGHERVEHRDSEAGGIPARTRRQQGARRTSRAGRAVPPGTIDRVRSRHTGDHPARCWSPAPTRLPASTGCAARRGFPSGCRPSLRRWRRNARKPATGRTRRKPGRAPAHANVHGAARARGVSLDCPANWVLIATENAGGKRAASSDCRGWPLTAWSLRIGQRLHPMPQ